MHGEMISELTLAITHKGPLEALRDGPLLPDAGGGIPADCLQYAGAGRSRRPTTIRGTLLSDYKH